MKRYIHVLALCAILCNSVCSGQSRLERFILIEGSTRANLEAFEILDHPVTNSEYEIFIKDTGYSHPLHWADGRIPPGKADHPVIFVNRVDVNAYLRWLTQKEGRMHRLPTSAEFEHAARGRLMSQRYPWGSDDPKGRANYDADADRAFDGWKDHLKSARWGSKNGYGLYGMAGNVWQMVVTHHDLATTRWKYRVEDPSLIESAVMGGSWARSEGYLR